MSINSRDPLNHRIDPGPYLGIVTSQLDPTYMGSLRVNILRSSPEQDDVVATGVIVRYCSPFFGATAQKFEGNNSSSFNDVQKSYGFWMVPPDVGVTVLVTFVAGDINQGYWFGCVPDRYQDHMVPGIAASQYSAMTAEQLRQYGSQNVPVAEFLKSSRDMTVPDPNKFTKPVHPFADRLVQEGLLIDDVRGITSSSARREAPSNVYGISTPGPIDASSPLKPAGFPGDGDSYAMPVSRLGGHQFVMDDGDKDGKNELFRIRTRTGHQILLHNSSDLIYIANSKGTAWIELTSDGKIDMYAEDSVSVHTLGDFNFLADRDINLEAGRSIRIKSNTTFDINCGDQFNLIGKTAGSFEFGDDYNLSVSGNINQTSAGDSSYVSGGALFADAQGILNLLAGSSVALTGSTIEMGATTNFKDQTNLQGTDPQGGMVTPIKGQGAQAATAGTSASTPAALEEFTLPNRSASAGWANQQFYKSTDITSIMQRVPTHEPWDQHENINPSQFSSGSTDTSNTGTSSTNVPLSRNGKANEAFLKSTLIRGGITDPIKLAAWMAQCKQESGGFIFLKELGPDSYFNKYNGRRDLGNTQPGDGPRFKGRGFIQCTGRTAYTSMSKYFGVDVVSQPQLVEQLPLAARSVLWFFNVFKASRTANINWDDVVAVTKLVNGGTNGLGNRRAYYAAYKTEYTTNGIGT